MAIPKICGIENEFSFLVYQKNSGLIDPFDEDKRSIHVTGLIMLMKQFLRHSHFIHRNLISDQDASLLEVLGYPVKKRSLIERLHRERAENIIRDLDGFLENGARFYLDDEHPEYSTPECLNPLDLVAQDKVSELIMMQALNLLNDYWRLEQKRDDLKGIVHKNNSDGKNHSWGCHLNVLLDRKTVNSRGNLERFILNYVPFQIARLVLIGSGKLGAENRRAKCNFQLSQRADFFEVLCSNDTTSRRPIFNLRDEPHANPEKYFRLHDISTDSLMCEYSIFLKVALTQIVIAMIEDGFWSENLFPRDPVEAIRRVSRDLKFKDKILLINGKSLTGMEILRVYLKRAKEYIKENNWDPIYNLAVKESETLLDQLEKDPLDLFGVLDWPTTFGILESNPDKADVLVMRFRKVASDGLYYEYLKRGLIKRLLVNGQIAEARFNPPKNTRAYFRGRLIKKHGESLIDVGWAGARIKASPEDFLLHMDDPVGVDQKLWDLLR